MGTRVHCHHGTTRINGESTNGTVDDSDSNQQESTNGTVDDSVHLTEGIGVSQESDLENGSLSEVELHSEHVEFAVVDGLGTFDMY